MTINKANQPTTRETPSGEGASVSPEVKPASGPKKALAKRNRVTKRVFKQRNALYKLAAEFKRRHPEATAAEAWQHFCAVAGTGAHDVVLRHDAAADKLEYLPDPERRSVRTVTRRTFFNQWYRLSTI